VFFLGRGFFLGGGAGERGGKILSRTDIVRVQFFVFLLCETLK